MSSNIQYEEPPEYLDKIGAEVVDASYKVYNRWGAGLLENFYRIALCKELKKKGFDVQTEVYLPIVFDDGETVAEAYRIDVLVEKEIIIEIKAVDKLLPVHHRQVRTYLKLTNNWIGYLVNFNSDFLKDDINRIIMTPRI